MPLKNYHTLPHLNFYLSVEDDLARCFKFIAPLPEHFQVHSDEFAKIILLAASEFENVLAAFKLLSNVECSNNITGYYTCIQSKFPAISDIEMALPRYDFQIKPLDGWSATQGPDWWSKGYNKIKHDRLTHPTSATLEYALNAVAGLQVLLLHYYRLRYARCSVDYAVAPKLINLVQDGGGFADVGIHYDWTLPGEVEINPLLEVYNEAKKCI